MVVIDVAMTETARLAHYVLPASSQFEKWEATFFTLEFPKNVFHLRAPLLEPLAGHAARAGDPPPARARARRARRVGAGAAARRGGAGTRRVRGGLLRGARDEPEARRARAGRALRDARADAAGRRGGRGAAARASRIQCAQAYPESVRRAGFDGANPLEQGEALFDAILRERSGVVFSVDEYEETWQRARDAGRAHPPRGARAARRARARSARGAERCATPPSRSCSRPASAARAPRTRSSAIRRGAGRTRTARCA